MNQQMLEMQTNTIEQVKAVQSQALEINERMADAVVNMMPEMPAPFAEYMPQPAEMMANYFDFLGEMGEANREFTKSMMTAWMPAETAPAKKKK